MLAGLAFAPSSKVLWMVSGAQNAAHFWNERSMSAVACCLLEHVTPHDMAQFTRFKVSKRLNQRTLNAFKSVYDAQPKNF